MKCLHKLTIKSVESLFNLVNWLSSIINFCSVPFFWYYSNIIIVKRLELKLKIKLFIQDKFIELNKNPADGMQKQSGHVVLLCKHMISKECKSRYYKSIQVHLYWPLLKMHRENKPCRPDIKAPSYKLANFLCQCLNKLE